jgi:hypothetical protein
MIGRFGNQLGQYAVARALAENLGVEFECAPWIGNELFDLHDKVFHPKNENRRAPFESLPTDDNWYLNGYFQFQEAMDLIDLDEVRRWFTFKPQYRLEVDPNHFYIAAHLRAGDTVMESHKHKLYAVVRKECFERAIVKEGYALDKVKWISEEEPHTAPGIPEHLQFIIDFQMIQQAPVIFRSNSTFSLWAAWLGKAYDNNRVFAASIGTQAGWRDDVEFIRGNHAMIINPALFKQGTRHTECIIRRKNPPNL